MNRLLKSANQIIMFYRDIKPNDVIIAADGHKFLGVEKVIDEYEHKDGLAFPHSMNVQWHGSANEKLPNPAEGLRTTVDLYKDIENLVAIEKLIGSSDTIPPVENQPQSLWRI